MVYIINRRPLALAEAARSPQNIKKKPDTG